MSSCSAASQEEKARAQRKPLLPLMTRANASRYASLSSMSQIWIGAASTFVRFEESSDAGVVLLLIRAGMITGSAGLTITRSSDARGQGNGRAAAGLAADFGGAGQLGHSQPDVFQSIA